MTARILVIEDNPANLELMTYLLRAYGYEPVSAASGERGLEIVHAARPDIVLCDIQLPGMDGYEIVRRLKADPAARGIPVVAITALAMVGDRERVLAAGFDGYIAKPIVPESFVAQIERFLGVERSAPLRAHEDAPAPASPRPSLGTRVLVVDNSPANLDLFESLLRPLGFDVTTAADGAAALDCARAQVPDLIISDIHMPGLSGFELLSQVRADPALGKVPFMLTSATSWDRDAGGHALKLGADVFLMRPIEPQKILEKVRRLLAAPPRGQ